MVIDWRRNWQVNGGTGGYDASRAPGPSRKPRSWIDVRATGFITLLGQMHFD